MSTQPNQNPADEATSPMALVPMPELPQTFDVANVSAMMEKARAAQLLVSKQLDADDAEAEAWATKFGVLMSGAVKSTEAQKEEEYRPHKEAADAVAAKYNPILKEMSAVVSATRTSLQGYLARKAKRELEERQRRAKAEEDEALAAAEKMITSAEGNVDAILSNAQKAADEYRAQGKNLAANTILAQADVMVQQLRRAAALKADKVLEAAPVAPKSAAPAAPIRTDFGTAHARPKLDYKVVDITKVPAAYLTLNESAVRKALGDGVTAIPGLEIFDAVAVSFRQSSKQ